MYFNDNIDAMEAYVPGEQPAAGAKVIKLNTNENPYPPSPKVREVLSGLDIAALRRYPDALAGEFRSVVADLLDVPPEWILPGDGSDDVIMMVARSALQPGRRCAYPVPTFDFYFTQAQIQGAERIEVPLDDDFRLPVDALIDARADVTFIANPNSPTGIAAPTDALAEIAAGLDGLVVIDEAYVDFAEDSALELLERHGNVIILRTLSKGYSLAGLRLGFGVARPDVLQGLLKTKSIYNVGTIPQAVGAAALADAAYHDRCVEQILESRRMLVDALQAMGYRTWPSATNFLLVRPPEGNAGPIAAALKEQGIFVRYYDRDRLSDKLRITVGTPEETADLVEALRRLHAGG